MSPAPEPSGPRDVTLSLRAPAPGDLEALDGLGLPPGRPVRAQLFEPGPVVAWVTEQPGDYADLWQRLALAFPTTGLWPLLAAGLGGGSHPLQRPWLDGELMVRPAHDDDAETLLSRRVEPDPAAWGPGEDWRASWAGLALPSRDGDGPVTIRCTEVGAGLLLVPVTRPADVPAVIGWTGPVNHDLTGGDITTVLRSWEDRFGAVLVHIGFDTLCLKVADGPSDILEIERLAREHYLFCPDNIDQGTGSLEDYLDLVALDEWWFWWD